MTKSHFSNFVDIQLSTLLHTNQVDMRTRFCLGIFSFMMACTSPKSDDGRNVAESPKQIEMTRWLIGSWQGQSKDAMNYEIWKKENDSTLSGRSYSINTNGDTVSSEFVKLVQRNGELAYIPTVPGQNKGMPTEFRLTFIDRNKMIFENPEHDFPQMITYKYLPTDSLIAEISGTVNGEQRSIQFPMRRSE